MPIKLCINCKKHVAKGIAVVNDATVQVTDVCKKAINDVAIQDFVTGERVIPSLESVQCRALNRDGGCDGFAKKDAPWKDVDAKALPVVVED